MKSYVICYMMTSLDGSYKAKNLIDTVVYRGGDQLTAWGYAALAYWLARREEALSGTDRTVQPMFL